jgi:S1-C subfamily serine protease
MRQQAILGAVLALGSLSPTVPTVSAQDPEVVHLESAPDRLIRIMMERRARLGIKVNLRPRETDSIGAYVDAVTPGGPADEAGIRSGDIITRLDGKSVLAGGAAEGGDRERQSLPGLRLIELAARLEPGDTVPVEYRRGTERRTASVVTASEPDLVTRDGDRFTFAFRGPRAVAGARVAPSPDLMERLEMAGPHWQFLSGSPLGRLELAPLNADLGRYFGTDDGVLVISAPTDSALGLKGGDVVLRVDGREPSGPSHLLRILRSYEAGESFKLDIMRDRKRQTVTARLGDRES